MSRIDLCRVARSSCVIGLLTLTLTAGCASTPSATHDVAPAAFAINAPVMGGGVPVSTEVQPGQVPRGGQFTVTVDLSQFPSAVVSGSIHCENRDVFNVISGSWDFKTTSLKGEYELVLQPKLTAPTESMLFAATVDEVFPTTTAVEIEAE
ncbi:MAG: hypothetical protein ACYTGP_04195 [Planctomycetota bacterium]|jgi:hypothetical protein